MSEQYQVKKIFKHFEWTDICKPDKEELTKNCRSLPPGLLSNKG
jgi:hypothetical protein